MDPAGPGRRSIYLKALPRWLGLDTQDVQFSTWDITKEVLVFLGIPLVLGCLTRRVGIARRGRQWCEETLLPRIGPWALYGLFTIVVMFALQGEAITSDPLAYVSLALRRRWHRPLVRSG